MALKCIICERLFGCEMGGFRYTCDDCRIADECSIRQFFTTTHTTYEICESCLENVAHPQFQTAAL